MAAHRHLPVRSAHAAGLRYVSDAAPGISRRRAAKAFRYLNAEGRAVRDRGTLARIRALAIPPAWDGVWICPRDDGHLQATGRDAHGRKQYRYHAQWREVRDETKYGRMAAFGRALPRVRRRVTRDLALQGLPQEKILATLVRLLETTLIRVGNEEYVRDNASFGLTTLRNRQVAITGAKIRFNFRGKSGVEHAIELHDRRMAGAWPASSSASASCPARTCSSTSMKPASAAASNRPTSTPTSARRPAPGEAAMIALLKTTRTPLALLLRRSIASSRVPARRAPRRSPSSRACAPRAAAAPP